MEKKKKDELNEPAISYSKANLKMYHSFEEANNAFFTTASDQTPLERIKETVELILRVYGLTQAELNKRPRSNRITLTHRK